MHEVVRDEKGLDRLSYVNFDGKGLNDTGVPWHGLGQGFDTWLTDEQAKEQIGWKVGRKALHRETKATRTLFERDEATGIFTPVEVPVYEELDDTFETTHDELDLHIASVGKVYNPFQGDAIIDFGSTLVNNFDAKWDTVGNLSDWKVAFATLRLDVVAEKSADEGYYPLDFDKSNYFKWLLIHDRRDGNGRLRIDVVRTRAVCANTVHAAHLSSAATFKIRHVGDLSARVEAAREALSLVNKDEEQWKEWATKLAESEFEVNEFEKMVESPDFFPVEGAKNRHGKEVGKREAKTNEANRAHLISNFEHSPTVAQDWRFTKWGAFNAVTEWAEHLHNGRQDSRTRPEDRKMLATFFGGNVQQVRDAATRYLS